MSAVRLALPSAAVLRAGVKPCPDTLGGAELASAAVALTEPGELPPQADGKRSGVAGPGARRPCTGGDCDKGLLPAARARLEPGFVSAPGKGEAGSEVKA